MSSKPEAAEVLEALRTAVSAVSELDFGGMSNEDRLRVLRELESVTRTQASIAHEVLYLFAQQRVPGEFGGEHSHQVVADALRINRTDAKRRFNTAEDLASRRSFTGEPLEPELPATATAVREGVLGDGHVQVIRSFLQHLPAAVDAGTREQAEAQLAGFAATMRPDELKKIADRLAAYLNPDGEFSDDDRARQRGIWLGRQGPDLMSSINGLIDPELRAYLEPIFAKLAAPGMCNPDDEAPTVDGEPNEDEVKRDTRSMGQRQHDAVKAMCRSLLASRELGQHRGLPVTVILSTTLRELIDLAGPAATAGGALLPMPDLIRLAAHAQHYLTVFDDVDGRPLYLGRSKRIASPDQRTVLHARDVGCSFPGCNVPGYLAEAHHVREWADGGPTDIDNLTSVCPQHHKLAGRSPDQWYTSAGPRSRTRWHPPVHVDPRQRPRINHFHHPAEVLVSETTDDPP
ncbi:HNH endonuclease [Aldersonia sp. NBC_00410]|uniref:HNH endonuclease signature motif containing protein n=1 Tax=Aldersonia sp. NBC_00410 TaxID=2975954 RepID=UPI00225A74D7|nr:HNH endonuclease signature motif containing protein [Aldersonia sp. NBC_00410]MCX5043833.1 HNH endonuclease [Aldersonia sp. NBC_00410]